MSTQTLSPIRIGISSCLLGEAVRYDGRHKRDDFISDTLGKHVDFMAICPEVAIGLGVPRPPIQLLTINGGLRVRGVAEPHHDVTAALQHYAADLLPQLSNISGYIFKSKSPSCGLRSVPVHETTGNIVAESAGLFAADLHRTLPLLPMAEEGELQVPRLRDHFLVQVFSLHRWQESISVGMTVSSLEEFHRRHKFLLQAHDELAYRQLGQMVADAGRADLESHCEAYIQSFMHALRQPATLGGHVNVLQHMAGFLKKSLSADEKSYLSGLIEDYRCQRIPRQDVVDCLQQMLQLYPDDYLAQQYYLNPYPGELAF